ncbi:glucosaminidase domain-containing protein [Enterococcus alishanensis]|uniref:Glucosaminidase domain-containing protein n=1 Tax=Enterococcus alishanensis TaxID=1303817 RepID=A0ABS6TB96_9ENTE|nr:glucosaminidase domain-containing protein [Enterococcus alishanensis]MBV7390175.1 glucosaminidase domain-containing protein [Enterococcus alishanensis]
MNQYKTRSEKHLIKKMRRKTIAKKSFVLAGTTLAISPIAVSLSNHSLVAQAEEVSSQSAFINQIGQSAVTISANHDLYASIMIAQALVESGYGSSSLSQAPYYNLFGVKEYNGGASVSMSTQEYLNGQWVTMSEPFAVYNSYNESFEAHADLLQGTYYAGAWKSHTSNYQEAAYYLQGRYATDPSYASKLISIIQTYNLTQYDTGTTVNNTTNTAPATESTVTTETNVTATTSTYTVAAGDSLWGIASSHGISVDQLLANNGLSADSTLLPGQQLTI